MARREMENFNNGNDVRLLLPLEEISAKICSSMVMILSHVLTIRGSEEAATLFPGHLFGQYIQRNVAAISRMYTFPISAGQRCVTASK